MDYENEELITILRSNTSVEQKVREANELKRFYDYESYKRLLELSSSPLLLSSSEEEDEGFKEFWAEVRFILRSRQECEDALINLISNRKGA